MNINPLNWFKRSKNTNSTEASVPRYKKSTAPMRRAAQRALDATRYLHVSKELIEVPEGPLRKVFGNYLVSGKKGTQYRSPRGVFRRHSNHVANQIGLSNKARRKMRSGMAEKYSGYMEQA